MEPILYIVEKIDGDYAHLRQIESPDEDAKLVARALLPDGIAEGSRLIYEWLEYKTI
ncbi:MAG: chorismate--pyruvate lyase [Lachnospiraceae bacterium]|nr:chorismate--pyruvate lyase [Lachnospiraceae bacterium]